MRSIIADEVFEDDHTEKAYFPTLEIENDEKKFGNILSKVVIDFRSFFT